MRARPLVLLATIGLVVLSWASPATAKGPDQATITGPGLDTPIVVTGFGEPGSGDALGGLADGSGLFLVMFGEYDSNQHLEAAPPPGPLGPKFEIEYRVPDGTSTGSTVRQDLYPMAPGGPVTYTEAGQSVFGAVTSGGWYKTPGTFSGVLQGLGLPATPVAAAQPAPTTQAAPATQPQAAATSEPSSTPWPMIAAVGAVVVLVVAGGILFARRRANPVAGRPELG